MGQETVYCIRCASRIGGADFASGRAYRVSGKSICANCFPEVFPTLTAEERREFAPQTPPRGKSTSKIKLIKPSASTASRLPAGRPEPPKKQPSRTPLIAGIAGIVLLLAVAAFWSMSRPSASPEPEERVSRPLPPAPLPKPAPSPPTPPPPEEKAEEPQLRDARLAIEAARAKAKLFPNDFIAQLAAWEDAARKAALTPLFREASAGLKEIRERVAVAAPTTAPPVDPPSPAPAPVAETGVSAALWNAAMAKASAGDFDGAAVELRKEPAGNAEADLLLTARAAQLDSRAEVSRQPVGQRIVLNYRPDSGESRHVEGTLVRAVPERLEIKQGEESVFVEIEDITAGSLVAICRPSEALRRRYALLLILEGERVGAERLAGADAFPSRYWDYAKDVKRSPAPSHELEARRLFYAAEKEFAKTETMASGIAKYRSLSENFGETRLVKSEAVRIKQRAETGKEYFFAMGALKATGTFALAPATRTELAWVSKADVEGNQALENYVEAEFAALPDVGYKCWALLGGCCSEVFACYLQTTEGTEFNSKTRQKVAIDPGAGAASPLKNKIGGLKKTHEEHKIKGSKTHPKLPARWEWVEIPLPKYAGPGSKKIRLLSDQQGFGVAIIVVSSTRAAPPSDADFKDDLTQLKGSAPPPPDAKPWRTLFDGKTKESVLRGEAPGWKVENGALLSVAGINDAAQTKESFTDGEIRIRFEGQDLEKLWFKLRQGGAAGVGYAIAFDNNLKLYEGKPHELIFTAQGDKVTATMDGKPIGVIVEGAAASGLLQFNGAGKRFAVLSLDVRP